MKRRRSATPLDFGPNLTPRAPPPDLDDASPPLAHRLRPGSRRGSRPRGRCDHPRGRLGRGDRRAAHGRRAVPRPRRDERRAGDQPHGARGHRGRRAGAPDRPDARGAERDRGRAVRTGARHPGRRRGGRGRLRRARRHDGRAGLQPVRQLQEAEPAPGPRPRRAWCSTCRTSARGSTRTSRRWATRCRPPPSRDPVRRPGPAQPDRRPRRGVRPRGRARVVRRPLPDSCHARADRRRAGLG